MNCDAAGISFRFIKPGTPIRAPYCLKALPIHGFVKFLIYVQTFIEIVNTRLPWRNLDRDKVLRKVCMVPKMSTYAIGAIIDKITSQLKDDELFVNVGLWYGFTFLAGLANNPGKTCVGIDNFSQFGGPKNAFLESFHRLKSSRHYFYEMDYREYFSKIHRGLIGFYIYDGHHSYENQLKGLKVAEPFFSNNCIILVDDTNIAEVHKATMDFIRQSPLKYKILLDQKTFCNAHPTFWNGIVIFQRIG